MRRSPKSFVVEVKRARKGVTANVFGVNLHKNQADDVETTSPKKAAPVAAATAPRQAPPRQPAPPRRILEALVTETAPPPAEPLAPIPRQKRAEAVAPTPRRSADKAPKAKKKVKIVSAEATSAPPAAAPAPVFIVPALVSSIPDLAVFTPAPRAAGGRRAEEASQLPRGERWKRRLPKALW